MPLFADLPEPVVAVRAPSGRSLSSTPRSSGPKVGTEAAAARHLAAARRLAKAIRRLPDHSPEQTRTGQAICQHLIALLEESNP